MKKLFLSFFVIIVFVLYAVFTKNSGNVPYTAPPAVTQNKPPVPQGQTAINKNITPMSMMAAKMYSDGEYAGNSMDAYYGNVQVKAIIQNGRITDVQFLDYPQDRGTSIRINTNAMPQLRSEAIQAQNANIDIVSGATQTSEAFVKSLATALTQAKS